MEHIQPPVEVITELSFPDVKRSGRESHHSLPTSSELHLRVLIWKGKTEWTIHVRCYVTFEVKNITIKSCPCRGLNDSSEVQPLSLVILTTLSEIKLWQCQEPDISPRHLILNFVTGNISWRHGNFGPEDRTEPHTPSCRSMPLVPMIKRLLCP